MFCLIKFWMINKLRKIYNWKLILVMKIIIKLLFIDNLVIVKDIYV